jgi:hypothetical protein
VGQHCHIGCDAGFTANVPKSEHEWLFNPDSDQRNFAT